MAKRIPKGEEVRELNVKIETHHDLSRKFIKDHIRRGASQRAARDAHNTLVGLSEKQIGERYGKQWMGLSGAPALSAKETHQIERAQSHRQREARKEVFDRYRIEKEAARREAEYLGFPEPMTDPQQAHDAGLLYRATNDEKFREWFEEGSR